MTFTHAISTNNYGPAKFIVSASAATGTHTTIAAALSAASSGDTIFIREGTYTENLTLVSGVGLTSYLGNVTIVGKCSYSGSGGAVISNITLQTNGDYVLEVTGTNVSAVTLIQCGLNLTNNTGIHFTSSNAGSEISLNSTSISLGTTGISIFTSTSAGELAFTGCNASNPGGSTTASTMAGGILLMQNSNFQNVFSTSSTTSLFCNYCSISAGAINTACLTTAGTGASFVEHGILSSGTASAISVGTGTTVTLTTSTVSSSNTNAITGAGTINFGGVTFISSSTINTSTQNNLTTR